MVEKEQILVKINKLNLKAGHYFLDDLQVPVIYLGDPKIKEALDSRNKQVAEHNSKIVGR
jgi:hypothetical protein